MAYGDALTEVVPTVGVTPGPNYATEVNEAIVELQGVVTSKVTPAGMLFDATVDLNSQDIENINALEFDSLGAPLSGAGNARKLFVASGEWYVVDGSGNAIQVTNAGSLNISSAGGITGTGYGSGGVEVKWDSGLSEYQLRGASGIEASIDALDGDFSGDLAVAGAAVVTGNITGANITGSGDLDMTGRLYHDGLEELLISSVAGNKVDGTNCTWDGARWTAASGTAGSAKVIGYPVTLPVGAVIDSVIMSITNSSADDVKIDLAYWDTGGSQTIVATTGTITSTGTITLSSLAHTVAVNRSYYIQITVTDGNVGNIQIHAVSAKYSKPAP